MIVRVAVPVKVARLRMWVDKGNDWSAVDRLILWALTEKAQNSQDLAQVAKIPARLLNGIILRLMHAGWVELAATPKGVGFRATEAGREAVEAFEILPVVFRNLPRRLSFVVEPFTLRAFSLREIKPYRPGEIEAISKEHDVRHVLVEENWSQLSSGHLHGAAEEILAEIAGDEELSSIDFSGSTFPPGFALFTVAGREIGGLPKEPPAALVSAIRRAAAERNRGATLKVRPEHAPSKVSTGVAIAVPPIDRNDILLTGEEHYDLLVSILNQARYRLILHSTFLTCSAFEKLKEEFRVAAKKGAKIDIFWGAARNEATTKRNLQEAIDINHSIQKDPVLRGMARAHMVCTRSHAKLVIADTGRPSGYISVVGSCNWLSAKFTRIEASVVLRHAHAVAQSAQEFADLILAAMPASDVAGYLNKLARDLKKLPAPSGASRIRMIKGDVHGELLRYARDKAGRRIAVGGDRLGLAAEARTLIPLMKAAERKVEGTIYYSRPSAPLSRADAAVLQREAAEACVRMIEIPDRELHGKFLLWDDDHLVITSLNWSSADTTREWPHSEMGVHLSGPGLATDFAKRFDEAWTVKPKEIGRPSLGVRDRRHFR
jgi:cardiolipin synthase